MYPDLSSTCTIREVVSEYTLASAAEDSRSTKIHI